MSTNGTNVEDTEMAECEGEKVVTMMDVLQEQQEFEEDANAVLGASDDKNCTYSKGYIKRQAVYACLTCCNDAKNDPSKRAGVCLACSLTCHENHDLVELYTKRNFRCDCGNPKFNHPCQYTENKTTLNDENIYNQNFSGLYCTCHRPYPDPDGVEEEMIQCIICEDWLHASHLEATVPSSELYAEMICKACMDKNEFLHDYSKYAVNTDVDVVDTSEILDSSIHCNGDTNKINGVNSKEHVDKVETEEISVPDEMKERENPTESKNTSHDNIDEQMEPNVTFSEKTDNENPLEENKSEQTESEKTDSMNMSQDNIDENKTDEQMQPNITVSEITDENPLEEKRAEHTASEKNGDENSIEDHTKVIVTDKTDDPNSTEENKAKDNNEGDATTSNEKGDATTSNETFDNTLGDNLDSDVSTRDQGSLDETNTEVDGTTNAIDVNSTEQKKQDTDIPQESNGDEAKSNGDDAKSNGDDASADVMAAGNINEDLKMDREENQEVPADSALMNEIDKNIETPEVADNHLENEIKENKRKMSTEESILDISAKKPKLTVSDCLRPTGQKKIFKGATFWPCHFRQKLCTCNDCITMYKDLSVLFLTDPEDTVTAYEVLGKEKADGAASTQYEKGLEALKSLGRIQQINALTEYNKMRDKLLDFLKSFKDRKEVVKEEDIKAFFAGMKPKREPDGVYFCR